MTILTNKGLHSAYEEIRDDLSTGDIVLFAGKGFTSKLIKFFTNSEYSHIGMVWKSGDWDLIMLWESTSLNQTKGVQTSFLRQRLDSYNGKLTIRHLSKPITHEMFESMKCFRKNMRNKPYEKSYWDLATSIFGRWKGKEDLSSVFCSELVAECYQAIGLLDGKRPSDRYTPSDFSAKEKVKLEQGYTLGKEIHLLRGKLK